MKSSNPLVSVIVPTKNSSKTLKACLESIKSQTYKELEIIVVDNHSTDTTKEIARKYTDKVFNKGPERSAQVNFGVAQARGEYVYKVDSDFVLDEGVVDQCVEKVRDGFDAVVVHNSPDIRVSWIAKIRKFEVDMYKYDITHSSARFVRKDVYEKIGGFNEKITAGEDYDFQNKLNRGNFKTCFVDAEALHLGEPTSFWVHMKKYYEYGRDFVNYAQENEKESSVQLGFFRKVYIRNWRKFIHHPVLGMEFIVYNLFKFGFGMVGYLSSDRKCEESVDVIDNIRSLRSNPISENPLVSIIIACKNNSEHIEKSLRSVHGQTYKNIELLIVDNFSTDGTFEIAKRFTKNTYQMGPERSSQFNFGFKKSTGDLIYRIGAEFVLEPDVVEKCVAKIRSGYDAVSVHNRSKGESIWAQVRYIERESYRNDDTVVAVRFMRREVFENVGMFDESLVAGEDFDLHNRIVAAGYIWGHADAVECHIGEPKNLMEVWNKFYYYGRTLGRYHKKNKDISKSQFIIFRPTFKKIQKDLLKSPRLFIAFYVYLFVKYAAGGLGMLRGAPKDLSALKTVTSGKVNK